MLERYQKNGVDLGKLVAFLAVAEELSFRGAAERLRQAQPAISRQVQGLEDALNCRLFRRDRRGTQLTSAGEELMDCLPAAFKNLENALLRTQAASEGRRGRLRIGCSPSSINTYLPAILRRFRETHSEVTIEMVETHSSALVEETHSGKLDCCFTLSVEPGALSELESEIIFKESIGVVLPDWHLAAKREKVRVSELGNLPFIQFPRERNPRFHDRLTAFFEREGVESSQGITIGSRLQAVGRVGAGMGFTTLTQSFSFLCGESTVFRPLAGKSVPQVSHRFLWSKQSLNTALAHFKNAVAAETAHRKQQGELALRSSAKRKKQTP